MPLERHIALVIEVDPDAIQQMTRVLAGIGCRTVTAGDDVAARQVCAELLRQGMAPGVIIARVALPSGSGIRMMEEAAAVFPEAACLLISHHPRNLLFAVPGFPEHSTNFLQAEFTDDQLQKTVERLLTRNQRAGQGSTRDQR